VELDETIPVIAAVVRRDGLFLLGRRPLGKRHGGLWEFPGGKVHPGESRLQAARRELNEELSLEVSAIGSVIYSTRDEGSRFVIDFTEVAATGLPVAHEHSDLGWFSPADLLGMPLAPADARFAERLQLLD
jgi:mutator protein MutT